MPEVPPIRPQPPGECRLCGSHAIEEWGRRSGQRYTDREFVYWRCRDCDLRFVDPVTGPDIYDDAYYAGRGVDPLVDYESEYTNYRTTPRLEEFEGLLDAASAWFAAAPAGHDPVGAGPLRWFDYGCGAGGLMRFLIDRGTIRVGARTVPIEVSGFDVGTYADRLKHHDHLNVQSADALSRLPPESFHVISLIEVLEHLERPLDVLTMVSRWLKPGGLLLVTTGNLAAPLARWQGVRFAYCIPEIHIALWTPQSLAVAYQRVGLTPQVVRCRGSLRFKVRKNLDRFRLTRATGRLWLSRPFVAMLDAIFGVTAMPMAVKPDRV